jgi:hypothetical protein
MATPKRLTGAVVLAASVGLGLFLASHRAPSEVGGPTPLDPVLEPAQVPPALASSPAAESQQNSPRSPLPKSSPVVSGRVVDEGGKPIEGARVYTAEPDDDVLTQPPQSDSTSDSAGHYTLKATAGAIIDVIARAEGFVPAIVKDVRVTEGEVPMADLVLRRGVEISGTVRLEDGSAVQGASVIAMGRDADSYRISSSALGRRGLGASFCIASTDAAGEFRLSGLLPDQQYLVNARRRDLIRPPGHTAILARGGAVGIALVMKPVVFVRLRPVDTTTGLLIPGARMEQLSSLASVPPPSLDEWGGSPRALKSDGELLLLGTETRPGSQIVIYAKAPGYETARLEVAPRRMTDDDGSATTVGLRPTAGGFGDLRLEAIGPTGEVLPWPTALRGVMIMSAGDRFGRGLQVEGDAAFLRHLPAGPVDVAPLAATPSDLAELLEFDREHATIDAATVNTLRLRVRLRRDRTAVVIRVMDEFGEVVRDSDVQLTGTQDGHHMRVVRFGRPQLDQRDAAVFTVGPGLWTLDVSKFGFKTQQQIIRVVVPEDPKDRPVVNVTLARE